jgi:hypothetical protein
MRVITLSCGFTPEKMQRSAPDPGDYFKAVDIRA